MKSLTRLLHKPVIIAMLLAVLALVLRLPGLGTFMTVDEEQWMLRSAKSWHEVFRNGSPGGTFETTHPGMTAVWLAGAGIAWQEARLGYDVDTSNLTDFRLAALLPIVLAISVMVGVVVWLVACITGSIEAWWAGLLLAAEPYLVGMSQVVHLDMLLALFMLAGVLSFARGKYMTSGVMAGLALATKAMPALWLFVFFFVFLVMQAIRNHPASLILGRSGGGLRGGTSAAPLAGERSKPRRPAIRVAGMFRTTFLVFGVAMLTFYIAWPALWTKTNLDTYYTRDVESIVQDAHVEIEESDEPIHPASFYVRTVLGRTSPFSLLLSVGLVLLSLKYLVLEHLHLPIFAGLTGDSNKKRSRVSKDVILLLAIYALGYLVLISFAAKKADRYALPALIVFPVLAGWAWRVVMLIVAGRVRRGSVVRVLSGFLCVLVCLQVLVWAPYAIAYDSPLFENIRSSSQQGWGEGIDAAARWLNERPSADELFVASWYPGVMRTYFNGKTMSLSSRFDDRVGYVVTYRNMYGRAPDDVATNVLGEFRAREPVHTILINDKPYAWIYETLGLHYFPEHVGEVTGDDTVGQLIPIAEDDFSAIEIGFATFSGRHNTKDVILHVRESVDASNDLRTVRVSASEFLDRDWHRFVFDPIQDASGRVFYVFLESPNSVAGDAITVWFTNVDLRNGDMVLQGRILPGRDIAYRIP